MTAPASKPPPRASRELLLENWPDGPNIVELSEGTQQIPPLTIVCPQPPIIPAGLR